VLDRAPDVSDDPAGEVAALTAVQRRIDHPSVVRAARAMSHFGEHAAGWLAIGAVGAALDGPRRRQWVTATAGVAVAHGASIVVKRVVRRPRPTSRLTPAMRATTTIAIAMSTYSMARVSQSGE